MIMEEFNVKAEYFEGPLDLMLSLIQKHKLNIRDIEISVLLEQFLLYLDKMRDAQIELAGEFIEMAARLILIKSAALLPKHEVEELKKELEGALIEYAQCREAAERLRRRFVGSDIFVREPVDIPIEHAYKNKHDIYEVYRSYIYLCGREKRVNRETELSLKPMVAKSYVSVFSKIMYVLKKMKKCGVVALKSIYSGQTRSEQVAVFLALLELSKYGRVEFSEDGGSISLADTSKRERITAENEA